MTSARIPQRAPGPRITCGPVSTYLICGGSPSSSGLLPPNLLVLERHPNTEATPTIGPI